MSNPSNCGDKLLPFIEMAIIEARPATTVLRLIALQSLVAPKGIRTSVLHGYRKLFVHVYKEISWDITFLLHILELWNIHIEMVAETANCGHFARGCDFLGRGQPAGGYLHV